MKVFMNGAEVDCLAKLDWDFYAPRTEHWVYGIKMPEDFEAHDDNGARLKGQAGDFLVIDGKKITVLKPAEFERHYKMFWGGGRGEEYERPF